MDWLSLKKTNEFLLKSLPILLTALGGFFLLFTFFFWDQAVMPIEPGLFVESITIPLDFINLGGEILPIEIDNALVFQNFESLPPIFFPWVTLGFGLVFWFLFMLGLTLVSTLRKMYFIGGTASIMFLLAFSGVNGLNIGGIASNYALIALLLGTIVPIVLIQFFFSHWQILFKFLLIATLSSGTMFLLIQASEVSKPLTLISESLTLPATVIAVLFMLHIGHAFISGVYIFLARLNKGVGLKISWHITVIFILYFLLLIFTLLKISGEINLPFPTIPPMFLMLICGIMGYFVLRLKIDQVPQPFENPLIGISFYWLGFAITVWTWWKADFTENQPLSEFFNNVFLYGQIALSLLFFAYLFTNFSNLMNKGGALEKVLFKPQFFAYFHMRIGAAMTLVILTIYGEGVIGVQLSTASTNLSADYYYQTDRPLEASILYENSWLQYRKNDKAKNAATHLRYRLNQPTAAMEHLIESFDNAPNVPNILLLSSKLHEAEKVFEAQFYLEKGLEYFPGNPHLSNNLSLLYSKLNRPKEALETINLVSSKNPVSLANEIGLKTKHGFLENIPMEGKSDLILQINRLATANRLGNIDPFEMDMRDLPSEFAIRSSLLRNLWSNHVADNLDLDLALLDSMIGLEQRSIDELHYRETRVVRTYQDQYINETLKYLNGIAHAYPSSGGYFHSLAAGILIGQLDFEKAAIDLLVGREMGFLKFKPFHLSILYFGGKPDEAKAIHQSLRIDFPEWMAWDDQGNLRENDMTRFYTGISNLHRQMPEKFMAYLTSITDKALKADLAFFILIHKAHWLSETELDLIKKQISTAPSAKWTEAELDELAQVWTGKTDASAVTGSEKVNKWVKPNLSPTRNAYFTPLVLKAVEKEKDDLKKYELLQEASQFNKDPLLWINFVKQSRKIGLESYGSNALVEMQGWLDTNEIEKLQMK
ncbi:M48 family metallopeptidase [Rhodonellum sp.]|uniref:tetratricopeptide repeat protein n=1 Tax=Rhodonellum sp. TaxID=2231180 RepID=UPI00272904DE|nr:hypothetical protein [Rhodonellum sp.]MDO9553193.1 hypothetical protein [Rhodonellum sp.]